MKVHVFLNCFMFSILLKAGAQPVTYSKDIAPVIHKNCSPCHSKNQVAPFTLDSYKSVKDRAKSIKYVLENGSMPPWKPDPDYSHFLGERILSTTDKKLITDWINNDCLEGPKYHPPTSRASLQKAEKERPADLIFKLPFKVRVVPNAYDTIVYLEIPYEIDRDTFISSYQFLSNIRSNYKSGIHHAFFTVEDEDHKEELQDFEEYYEHDYWNGKELHHRKYSTRFFTFGGGWVPGQPKVTMPDGIGLRMAKKGMLIFIIHYGPTPKAFDNTFELQLNFTSKPVTRIAEAKRFGTNGGIVEPYPPLVIPADSIMTFTLNTIIPIDYSIIALSPHMHLLGKSFKVWVVKPGGDTVHIINVKDWDFDWQGYYFPLHLLKLDSGSRFHAEVKYDNTRNNLRNPFNPPRVVRFGPRTRDEMLELNVYGVYYRKGDELLSIEK